MATVADMANSAVLDKDAFRAKVARSRSWKAAESGSESSRSVGTWSRKFANVREYLGGRTDSPPWYETASTAATDSGWEMGVGYGS